MDRGFTLIEFLIVAAIIAALASFALPPYQRYAYRAKAAGVAVEAGPIQRGIQELNGTVDRSQYRLQLENGGDGSILGCQAPAGSVCGSGDAKPAQVVVTAERLLIYKSAIRVSAAPCHVDCPNYALKFSSDMGASPSGSGSGTAPPATPSPASPDTAAPPTPAPPETAAPPPTDPEPDSGGKGKGKGKGQGHGQGQSSRGPGMSLVPSAHAASGDFDQINRVLYEFGEVMRRKAHDVDNAGCLIVSGPCTVTVKY